MYGEQSQPRCPTVPAATIALCTTLLLASVAAADPSSECVCPSDSEAPLLIAVQDAGGQAALIACGSREETIDETRVKASEFGVYRCGEESPILWLGALRTAYLEAGSGELRITEMQSWPFGAHWEWVEVPLWSFTLPTDPSRPIEKRLVLSPPELSDGQIKAALGLYHSMRQQVGPGGPDSEALEKLIGQTLAVALVGDDEGRRNLRAMPQELELDGAAAELYMDAYDAYQAYASATGRVPGF